jgi:hypothetical protein
MALMCTNSNLSLFVLTFCFSFLITWSVVAVLPVPGIPEMYKLDEEPWFLTPDVMYSMIWSRSLSRQGNSSGTAFSWSF